MTGLVYISAFVPDSGESTYELVHRAPQTLGLQAGRDFGGGGTVGRHRLSISIRHIIS
ncbi:MAG: hypothetical protein NVS2B16_32730 [Chloroflexota bacterium]